MTTVQRTGAWMVLVLPILAGCASGAHSRLIWQCAEPELATGPKPTVTVGTYNLKGLTDPEGLARTLQELAFVDVWAFQEVSWLSSPGEELVSGQETTAPRQLLSILPAGAWKMFSVPLNFRETKGGKVWEGQVIASRHPLTDKQTWPLSATGRKQRAALAGRVSVAGMRLLVVNTDHEMDPGSIGPADRMRQVEDLVARLRPDSPDRTNAVEAVVVLGDFNTAGQLFIPWGMSARKEISQVNSAFSRIGIQPLPEAGAFPTFRQFGISRPLDHIYLRGVDCCRWGTTTGYTGSDHRPLWATLRLEEAR